MKLCIFGAGAVGSHLAARLIRGGGADVSLVARGAHLAAMQASGLTLQSIDETFTVAVPVATDDPDSLPPQDVIIVGLKSHSLPAIAPALGRLLAPDGVALFCLNGIPWWWNHGLPGDAGPLPLIDPDGGLWRTVGAARALGAVIYSPNEIIAPGVIDNASRNNSFILGEPDGTHSPRLKSLIALFENAGIRALPSSDIRRDIWVKLLRNASNGPLAALTRLIGSERDAYPELNAVGQVIIDELVAIAGSQGHDIAAEVTAKRPTTPALAAARPSMLQDVLLGRPMEVESQLGQPALFGAEAGLTSPTLTTVLALLRGLNHSLVIHPTSAAGAASRTA